MNNGLHAATAGIKGASDTILNRASDYGSDRTLLANAVSQLMGVWHGDAAGAFNDSFVEVNKTLQDFEELLGDLGGAVGVAGGIIEDAEIENKDSARKLAA